MQLETQKLREIEDNVDILINISNVEASFLPVLNLQIATYAS